MHVHCDDVQDAGHEPAIGAGGRSVCANPSCDAPMPDARGPGARYCTPACSARARAARYRATPEGRARAAEYRRTRRSQERERGSRRRAATAAAAHAERLERVRASIGEQLPRTAGQIEAVRRHIAELTDHVERAAQERDVARRDARQLARLARHLFLTTGAPGFDRAGIQALFATYLTAADRRQVPAPYADVDLAALGAADAEPGAGGGERPWR